MGPISVRDAQPVEQEKAWRLALAEPNCPAREAERICRVVQTYLDCCGGKRGGLHLAEASNSVIAACAALDLPGRASMLLLPAWVIQKSPVEGVKRLLSFAAAAAEARGCRFAQILLAPQASERLGGALQESDYTFLAELRYLQRSAFDPLVLDQEPKVSWLTLDDADESMFAETIARTYIDTQDCPGLTGIRSMEEVLAGHKAAGQFAPDGWFLLMHRGEQPVGVVLTARTPANSVLELVYMGLVPSARGQGLGRPLVHRTIVRAREMALPTISLAVDAANQRAEGLYKSMGFVLSSSKHAWIKVFGRADAEGKFSMPSA